jgi:hypothetical protein
LDRQAGFSALFHELSMDVPPFAEAGHGQEGIAAGFFQSASTEFFAEVLVEIPDPQERQEIALGVAESQVGGICGLLELGWANAWVLGFKGRGDDEHFVEAAVVVGSQEHPTGARRDGPVGQGSTDLREASVLIDGFDFAEGLKTFAGAIGAWWIEPGERFDVIDLQGLGVQDGCGQIASHDFGLCETAAREVVLFVEQTDCDAGSQSTASTAALVG